MKPTFKDAFKIIYYSISQEVEHAVDYQEGRFLLIPASSSTHAEVSSGKTLNPKLHLSAVPQSFNRVWFSLSESITRFCSIGLITKDLHLLGFMNASKTWIMSAIEFSAHSLVHFSKKKNGSGQCNSTIMNFDCRGLYT